MSQEKVRLKPQIEKIIITDKEKPDVLRIEVSGIIDSETLLLSNGILGLMTEMKHKPRAEIFYKGTILRIGFPSTPKSPSSTAS